MPSFLIMQALETYNLILCLIVFVGLTALFTVLIVALIKNALRIINAGLDDEKIKQEYILEQGKKKNHFVDAINNACIILMCVILACALVFSLYSRFTENSKVGAIPTVKVVETGSMETKHKNNTYLVEHNLDDQISTFDLVVLHQLPAEEDLQLYDIVVYETKGYFVIHRIVGIEEPNAKHPNERWYVLRGDANERADEFPVTYSQMCSIYRGERLPFVGAFVMFMQSPAGMLCFLLVIFAAIALPIVEKKMNNAINERLVAMGLISSQTPTQASPTPQQVAEMSVVATVAKASDIVDATATDGAIQQTSTEESTTVEDAVDVVDDGVLQVEETQSTTQSIFSSFGKRKTFDERLALLDQQKIDWYNNLVYVLLQIPSVRRTQAKYHELYRKGNKSIAKVVVKGKSLFVYLAVDANQYQGRQYGFKDISSVSAHSKLPCECKVTSRRKLKNILKILATYGDKIKTEMPAEFDFFKLRKKLTLKQKLYRLPKDRKDRYKQIVKLMDQKPGVTRWESKHCITYKSGHKPLLKITIKGKSVCVYLAVDPIKYTATKYGIKDVSTVKAYKDYPAFCKVTSDRRLKYVLNIISEQL